MYCFFNYFFYKWQKWNRSFVFKISSWTLFECRFGKVNSFIDKLIIFLKQRADTFAPSFRNFCWNLVYSGVYTGIKAKHNSFSNLYRYVWQFQVIEYVTWSLHVVVFDCLFLIDCLVVIVCWLFDCFSLSQTQWSKIKEKVLRSLSPYGLEPGWWGRSRVL